MITAVHTMFYSSHAAELRAFLRDKLGFPATDVGGGWLIFDLPGAEMGVHPLETQPGHPKAPPSGTHYISFMCDDIHKTVAELRSRGVKFDDEVKDQGYGHAIHFTMPGEVKVELYQAKYKTK